MPLLSSTVQGWLILSIMRAECRSGHWQSAPRNGTGIELLHYTDPDIFVLKEISAIESVNKCTYQGSATARILLPPMSVANLTTLISKPRLTNDARALLNVSLEIRNTVKFHICIIKIQMNHKGRLWVCSCLERLSSLFQRFTLTTYGLSCS